MRLSRTSHRRSSFRALGDRVARIGAMVLTSAALVVAGDEPPARAGRAQDLIELLRAAGTQSQPGRTTAEIERELAAIGAPAVPLLAQALQIEPDGRVRESAARVLGYIGPAASSARYSLRAALGDASPSLRAQAAASMVSVDPSTTPEAVRVLIGLLKEPDAEIRLRAVRALGDFGHASASAVPALKVALADSDRGVRDSAAKALEQCAEAPARQAQKDRLFLMGIGMLRINWTDVRGNEIRFRYSDLGLPAEFSTRERASFMIDGTFGGGRYDIDGHLDYDPENRITEPPLDFFVSAGNKSTYGSAGDFRTGVFLDSIFSQYFHPFRGGLAGKAGEHIGAEAVLGIARGESGIDEFPADAGAGPYYIQDTPILRGSEVVFLVTKSAVDPSVELSRRQVTRNVDYFVDYDRGALIFNYSLYPTDDLGNLVFVLVSYQFEALGGRFTRDVYGMRAWVSPASFLKASFSYIADSDSSLSFADAFEKRRGISSLGLRVDSKRVYFVGEVASSAGAGAGREYGVFGGGRVNITDNLRAYVDGWRIASDFSTFANRQLQYGYSLYQIFPSFAERSIFLSPFQFTRNLGADLYPFTLARLTAGEREATGFLEWDRGHTRYSGGYGIGRDFHSAYDSDLAYFSTFHDGDATKYWGKFGAERTWDSGRDVRDSRDLEALLGLRQRLLRTGRGDLFVQADFNGDQLDDLLDILPDTRTESFSIAGEFLTGQEGVFAGYRKQRVVDLDDDEVTMDGDIFEAGVKRPVYKWFFVDTRLRHESVMRGKENSNSDILSLGGGIESREFRALGRYEVQLNKAPGREGRRHLWSLFLFGSPLKALDVSLRYYRQSGTDEALTSLTERSEEQLNVRVLWKVTRRSSVYSQWRYDTNIELYPPLNRTRSNSVGSIQGVTFKLTRKLDFLANYKLLRVWGPIENRRETAAAELGYLLFKHFRFGVGAEYVNFRDQQDPAENYTSRIGYFKLVALF